MQVWRSGRIIPQSGAAVDYLIRTQEQDGSWYGRWGVNYVYGTFLALAWIESGGRERPRSLCAAGRRVAPFHSECRWRMGRKLRKLRQANASSPAPSTPSQTAWAILGLLAGGDETSLSVQKGHRMADRKSDEPMELGTKRCRPEPVFRRSFICRITCIETASRCLPWAGS